MALRGIRVLELAGLAPVPFCSMMMADFGADVIRIDKIHSFDPDTKLGRGKRSIAVDLKHPEGQNIVMNLAKRSDVLIEPYRADVMERLGLGPKHVMEFNPKLIYARLTGYGQTGPLSTHAGHDINFLGYSGLLWALGSRPPINLMADFAGGGLLCSFAIAAALLQRSITGKGQVIDLNMTQGAAYVASWLWRSRLSMPFIWTNVQEPGKNLLDGGRAFYDVYETSDGGHVAVGAVEPHFFHEMLTAIGVEDHDDFDQVGDQDKLRKQLQQIFIKKDKKYWGEVARKNPNSCLSPVLTFDEAPHFDHSIALKSFVKQPNEVGGGYEPIPVPTSLSIFQDLDQSPHDPPKGANTREILSQLLRLSNSEIDQLKENEVIDFAESHEFHAKL